nr:hypothetical protein [Caulerpa lentillifera]
MHKNIMQNIIDFMNENFYYRVGTKMKMSKIFLQYRQRFRKEKIGLSEFKHTLETLFTRYQLSLYCGIITVERKVYLVNIQPKPIDGEEITSQLIPNMEGSSSQLISPD